MITQTRGRGASCVLLPANQKQWSSYSACPCQVTRIIRHPRHAFQPEKVTENPAFLYY